MNRRHALQFQAQKELGSRIRRRHRLQWWSVIADRLPHTMQRIREKIALCLVCASVAGCGVGSVLDSDRNLKEPLAEADVIGTWNMTSDTLSLLRRDGFSPATTNRFVIAFATNGTCMFQSIYSSAGQNRYVSASGTWKLEHDTQGDSNVRKRNAIRIEVSSAGADFTEYLNFTKEGDTLILWNYYGDPDEGKSIEYARGG